MVPHIIMNHHIRRGDTMLTRAIQCALENPIESELAATLLTDLQLRIAGIEQIIALQHHGHAAMIGAAENRQDHANALRETMRDLARIARVLDPREYPDIAHQMRTANLKVYSELLARAQCFIDAARPMKAVFIAYGAPADFLTRMESQIAAVNAAERRKFDGQGERINATASLTTQTREAIRVLRQLQVIHANFYRDQPGLAATWKAATHIERARRAKQQITDDVSMIALYKETEFAAMKSSSVGKSGDRAALECRSQRRSEVTGQPWASKETGESPSTGADDPGLHGQGQLHP